MKGVKNCIFKKQKTKIKTSPINIWKSLRNNTKQKLIKICKTLNFSTGASIYMKRRSIINKNSIAITSFFITKFFFFIKKR